LRGTVISTMSGANFVTSSHHAAAKPLAAAWSPWLNTAALIRAASVNGLSSTKNTPRPHERHDPDATRRRTVFSLTPSLLACASVMTPSWLRR
jgi:hypothetical protein